MQRGPKDMTRRTAACVMSVLVLAVGSMDLTGLAPVLAQSRGDDAPPAVARDPRFGDGGVSAFYHFTGTLPRHPGQMLDTEPLAWPTPSPQWPASRAMPPPAMPSSAARGIRMLYSATDGVDSARVLAVSGQILFPRGAMPPGGWPIVAWAHGTTGVADVCAPSWRGFLLRDRTYLNHWLDQGFAVVATDYQGLGTPGPHPYLLFRPEGYSTLDGVRAALRAYPTQLRNQVILVGQSQGSGAALGAAWLAPTYAPELTILGVVATGLVVDFAPRPAPAHAPLPVSYDDVTSIDAAFAMLIVEGTDQSLHPQLQVRDFMSASGLALSHIARTGCLADLFQASRARPVATKDLFTRSLAPLEQGRWQASRIPSAAIPVPVFAATGLADSEAGLAGQYNAVAAMCDAGATVVWHTYPGLTHNGTLNASVRDSLPFVRHLMAHARVTPTCAELSPPGPVQAPAPGIPFNH